MNERRVLKAPKPAAEAFLEDLAAQATPAPVDGAEGFPGVPTDEIEAAVVALVTPYYESATELAAALVESDLDLRRVRRQLRDVETQLAAADETNGQLLLELQRCRRGDDDPPPRDDRGVRVELEAAQEALARIARLARPHVRAEKREESGR